MGLDIVEFMMAVEGSFGIDIPNRDAATLETPQLLIDYLSRRLPAASLGDTSCLTQRIFYRARTATSHRFQIEHRSLRPQTVLSEVIGSRTAEWKALRADIGSKQWPRLKSENRFFANWGGVSTLGELARHLATYDVEAMRDTNAPWTQQETKALVLDLLETELGVDMTKHTLDSYFVQDMGLG